MLFSVILVWCLDQDLILIAFCLFQKPATAAAAETTTIEVDDLEALNWYGILTGNIQPQMFCLVYLMSPTLVFQFWKYTIQ